MKIGFWLVACVAAKGRERLIIWYNIWYNLYIYKKFLNWLNLQGVAENVPILGLMIQFNAQKLQQPQKSLPPAFSRAEMLTSRFNWKKPLIKTLVTITVKVYSIVHNIWNNLSDITTEIL